MADRPALFYLDRLRKLAGEPHVSSPENNAGVLKVERVFTKPRGWTPPAYGDADPNAAYAGAGCVLTHLEVLGADNGNLEYYTVYETIPGTLLTGTQLDERGDTQTVQTQIVAAGTAADAATLLVEGAVEAIDNVRSRRTKKSVTAHSTLTGAELDDDGALVTTTDDIVAPGSVTPAGGLLVNSDVVEVLTKQKARRVRKTVASRPLLTGEVGITENRLLLRHTSATKKTTTKQKVAAGTAAPTNFLTVASSVTPLDKDKSVAETSTVAAFDDLTSRNAVDPKADGGATTTVEHIQTPGTGPATPTFRTVEAKATAIDALHELRETTTLDAEAYPQLAGQNADPTFGIAIPFTEQIKEAGSNAGDAYTDIQPLDRLRSKVRVTNISAIQTALLAYSEANPGRARIDLPDVLTGVAVLLEKAQGDGDSTETTDYASLSGTGSLSISAPNSSEASASAVPEVLVSIASPGGRQRKVVNWVFFLVRNSTDAQITTKLATLAGVVVSDWPSFRPQTHTVAIFGAKVSVRAQAQARYSISIGETSNSAVATTGHGHSKDVGANVRSKTFGPVIHGAISFTGTLSDSNSVSVTASSTVAGYTGTSGTITGTCNAYVSPTSLGATSGASAIPTSGKYLYKLDTEPYKYGLMMIRAQVFDFADL